MNRLLVLGIGNILMQDEGIGVHLVRYLEQHYSLPEGVDVLDGGTGSFHLMEYFDQYPVILIVDAIMDGRTPGSFRLLKPRFSSDYPRTLTAHDIGLKDLLDGVYLQENEKRIYVFAISIKDSLETSTELSQSLQYQINTLALELHHAISAILEKERI
jgi:hydrogenase maturation protease